MAKHTHKGTCQVCGSVQAITGEAGVIAKHGYTVEWGFFNGTCSGSHSKPLEQDKWLTETMIKHLREEGEAMAAKTIADIKTASLVIRTKGKTYTFDKDSNIEEELGNFFLMFGAPTFEELAGDNLAAIHRQAKSVLGHADYLTRLIEKRHGQELYPAPKQQEVERIKELYNKYQQAVSRKAELTAEGWRARLKRSFEGYVVTATRKVAA